VIKEIPLVGRHAELDRIVSGLIANGHGGFVIAGPAGVGKTRLAAEAARAVTEKGCATARVVGTRAASSIPFGAFAPLLPQLDADGNGLLGLLRRATDAVLELNRSDQGLLLVVDDAHQLDNGSAALVHQLAQAEMCQVVATVRTPGRAPDPVTALWKDSLADRVDLSPLVEADVERLAATTLGGAVAGPTVRWLWETSAGNPMFVRELLVGASDAGALFDHGGIWVIHLPMPAPERLAELVASRLEELAPATAAVVDLLAVGEPLESALLEAIVGRGATEDAEWQGLIVPAESGRRTEYRLGHPLYADVRRQRMPRAKLRRLSSTLAEALLATGALRRDDIVRVAGWQLDAGERGDPDLFAQAAASARQMYNLDLAARLARAALESGGGVRAGLALGEAEFFSGRPEAAEQVLSGLVPICANDEETARVASARSYNLAFLMADKPGAEAVVAQALSTITDPAARARLLARLGIIRVYGGEPRLALDNVLTIASGDEDDPLTHRGMAIASVALAFLGRTDESVRMARRGFEAHVRCAERTQVPESQYIGSVFAHTAAGDLAQADAEVRMGYEASLGAGDNEGVATFCLMAGMVNVEKGDLAQAARKFREGMALNQELRDPGPLRWCLGGVALAEGMAGRAQAASAALVELDKLAPHWLSALDGDLAGRGRAWVRVATGEVSAGRAILREAAAEAAAGENYPAEARLLHDISRLGDPASVVPRLGQLSEVVDGDLVSLFADHARASAGKSRTELEMVAERFENLGALLLAAEAACEASAACRREGLHRRASTWDRKVDDLKKRWGEGEVRTPGLAMAGEVEPLTRREREVAELAASGVASKDIADRLFLSVRTVENHLQHVYSKLGVTGRDQLVSALGVALPG
jgi:DNA-binding CsgD family transcriptional regulator